MILWLLWQRPEERPGLRPGSGLGPKKVVLTNGRDREEAKRNARHILLGNPDEYVVEPIISSQDELVINLTIEGKSDATAHPRRVGW